MVCVYMKEALHQRSIEQATTKQINIQEIIYITT